MLSLSCRSLLSGFRSSLAPASQAAPRAAAGAPRSQTCGQVRHRNSLAPKSTPYPKRQKGTIPVPTGGSTKGTTLAFGEWGIRINGNGVRISAKQLQAAEEVIKRKIKVIKGARVWLRVFPDIPVCIKVRKIRRNEECMLTRNDASRVTKLVWARVRARSSSGQRGESVRRNFPGP
jgi:ribosomal protein L16